MLPRLRILPALALLAACSGTTTDTTTGTGSQPTVPGSPSITSATAGNASATVSFNAPTSDGGSAITSYTVSCTPSGGSTTSHSGSGSPITVTGLTNGTTYSCAVTANNAVGASVASPPSSVTPATVPDAPTQVVATSSNAAASVMFTAPANNGGSAITGYTATCTSTGAATKTGTATASPITVSGLSNGTVYSCTVVATNAIGSSVASSAASVTPTASPTAPTAPQSVTAKAGNDSAIVSFSVPTSDGGSAITGYTASCSATGATTKTASGTSSPIAVTGLTNGTTYTCAVVATNAIGSSPASSGASVTPTDGKPGAPTSPSATAGNDSATVSFTAPANTGTSAITSYTVTCSATGATTKTATGASSPIKVGGLTNGTTYSCTVAATNSAGTGPSSSAVSVTPTSLSGTVRTDTVGCSYKISGTSTGSYQLMGSGTISYSLPYSATWSCGSSRVLTGNGIPSHTSTGGQFATKMGTKSVNYTFTLTPALASKDSALVRGIMAYALNSVKFDPGTDGTCNNNAQSSTNGCVAINGTGPWNIEAVNSGFALGLDASNAHTQPDSSYHYHGLSTAYLTQLGNTGTQMTLIGWALDGFPVYGLYGHDTATSATSPIREMKGSYQFVTTISSLRPDTSIFKLGTFTQDYQYVSGSGDLDECNGRFGVTPEFPNGIYHYYITKTYPFVMRCFKGTPATFSP